MDPRNPNPSSDLRKGIIPNKNSDQDLMQCEAWPDSCDHIELGLEKNEEIGQISESPLGDSHLCLEPMTPLVVREKPRIPVSTITPLTEPNSSFSEKSDRGSTEKDLSLSRSLFSETPQKKIFDPFAPAGDEHYFAPRKPVRSRLDFNKCVNEDGIGLPSEELHDVKNMVSRRLFDHYLNQEEEKVDLHQGFLSDQCGKEAALVEKRDSVICSSPSNVTSFGGHSNAIMRNDNESALFVENRDSVICSSPNSTTSFEDHSNSIMQNDYDSPLFADQGNLVEAGKGNLFVKTVCDAWNDAPSDGQDSPTSPLSHVRRSPDQFLLTCPAAPKKAVAKSGVRISLLNSVRKKLEF